MFPLRIITRLSNRNRICNFTTCQFSAAVPSSSTESNNALQRFIHDKICTSGPITVAEYMQLFVSSQQGYYSRKEEIFGEKGDFVTSPELTQVFGELVGAWILNELHMSSWTGPWQLVELGPGSGALMVDILRVLHKLQSHANMSVHFVEKSESLIERQKRAFQEGLSNKQTPMHWHDAIEHIPEGFTVFLANEFFDALPVHQFVRNADNPSTWHEVYVNLEKEQENFCFMLSSGENIHTRAFVPDHIRRDPGRTHWEYCPTGVNIVREIVKRFTSNGGFALILDYGHDGTRQNHSLRAYRGHSLANPLEAPGQVDLTADVDFGELKRTIQGKCLTFGPVEQRKFLSELGLAQRVKYLLSKCPTREQGDALLNACQMLVSDEEMGTRFKALSMFPSTLGEILDARGGVPAGFASTVPGISTATNGEENNGM